MALPGEFGDRLNGQSSWYPSAQMNTWHGYTPDGRDLVVRREGDSWFVKCGSSESGNRILDIALIDAIRTDNDLVAHARRPVYASWVRAQAALIEEELGRAP
jgi:hypothetical protein